MPKEDEVKTVREQVEERKARKAALEKKIQSERENRFQELREEPPEEEATPLVVDEEKPPVEDEKPPVEDEKPPVEDEKPPVEDEEDDDFDDFAEEEEDEVDSDDPEEEEVEEEEEEEEPTADSDTKVWRERIQEQGRLRKAAEAKTVELETENDSLKEELQRIKDQNKDIATNQINWNAHTEIAPLWDKFDEVVGDGVRHFSDAEQAGQFRKDSQASLLEEYYALKKDAKTPAERDAVDINYKNTLAERYGVEDGAPLVNAVRNALAQYIEIQDKTEDLKKKHEEGRLSVGVRAYEEAIKPFEDIFEDMGTVDEEAIQANPQTVESVVGKKYAEDEDYRKRAEKTKDRIKQFVFGLRPLTQSELEKAERRAVARGMSLEEFLSEREVNFNKARTQFLHDTFFSSMAMDEFPEMRKVWDRVQRNKKKRDAARKQISKAKPTDTDKPKKTEEKPVRAKDRPYVPPSKRVFSE